MSLSAHKIYGPKGVGALIVDKRIELKPIIAGRRGHEQGMRSAHRELLTGIVGFRCGRGAGRRRAGRRWQAGLSQLRERLEAGLHALGAVIFGEHAPRIRIRRISRFRASTARRWCRARQSRVRGRGGRGVLEREHRAFGDADRDGRGPGARAARCVGLRSAREHGRESGGFLQAVTGLVKR
jgi:hypothetical protein